MLIGEYLHVLDSKKRLSLPAKFRAEVGKSLVVTRGLDKCLFVFPVAAWKEIVLKVEALPMGQKDMRGISRFLFSGATEIDVDSAGRILIPDFLRVFAGLEQKIALVGVGERIEIWSNAVWGEYKREMEKTAEGMAQTLGELRVL
jgi:MraZ protein